VLPRLEDACAFASLVPACPHEVGICREGRCAGRPPLRPKTCADARLTLAARLAAADPCASDAECVLVDEPGRVLATHQGYPQRFAAELRDIRESCAPGEAVTEGRSEGAAGPRCVERRCVVGPPGAGASPASGSFTVARAKLARCVVESVHLPRDMAGRSTELLVKFVVSERGMPQAFSFLPDDAPEALKRSVAAAISSCEWEAGTRDGRPERQWVRIPIRFIAR
jgi:hypothetical protein